MSKESHNIKSYIIGFGLSLLFTFVPYYLLTRQSLSGNALLVTILGCAVVQMVIQVVFFLHLGREPKPRWNLLFFMNTIAIILFIVVASIWIMNHLHYNMMPVDVTNKISKDEAVHQIDGKQAGTCPGEGGVDHKVVLKKDVVSPRHTEAHLCDTITITTESDTTRMIMFGTPEQLKTYGGESGETIRSGHNQQVTLTEPGTFQFYDHSNTEISGDFTVAP
jgi:cytochrome o ubiquinol oxidase operon protein cyoD